jgi:hypothetical protein
MRKGARQRPYLSALMRGLSSRACDAPARCQQASCGEQQYFLLAAEGLTNLDIAAKLDITNSTGGFWRRRFAPYRMQGLHDELRPGRPRSLQDERVAELITTVLHTKPSTATPWSVRAACRDLPQHGPPRLHSVRTPAAQGRHLQTLHRSVFCGQGAGYRGAIPEPA